MEHFSKQVNQAHLPRCTELRSRHKRDQQQQRTKLTCKNEIWPSCLADSRTLCSAAGEALLSLSSIRTRAPSLHSRWQMASPMPFAPPMQHYVPYWEQYYLSMDGGCARP